MGTSSRNEYLQTIRPRYRSASKDDKKRILDEFCLTCGYHRKYAIRILNSNKPVNSRDNLSRRGKKKIYENSMITTVLTDIWKMTNLPCSKRLKEILPLWLPFYDKHPLDQDTYYKLLSISPATIDRIMAKDRAKFGKLGLSATKTGSIIKTYCHKNWPVG